MVRRGWSLEVYVEKGKCGFSLRVGVGFRFLGFWFRVRLG